MIFFPNEVLQRYTLTKKVEGIYGEPKYEYEYSNDILVDFQNMNEQESLKEFGTERHNAYKIYFDINTDLNDEDELKDNHNNRYQIIGNIMEYSHFLNYKKAILILKRDKNE